jgi:glucose/arabinose dehydrogenase
LLRQLVLDTGAPYGGAFRSQDPASWDGKIIRVTPSTGVVATVGNGFHHAWRGVMANGTLFVADVGDANTEEVNRVASLDAGANFGYPCVDGTAPIPEYAALNTTVCEALYAANSSMAPWFSYVHPDGGI